MPGMPSPYRFNNGLSLRELPWDPALAYRALTDPTAVDFFTVPHCCGAVGGRAFGGDGMSCLRGHVDAGEASRATVVTGSHARGTVVRSPAVVGNWMVVVFFHSPSLNGL